MTAVLTGDIHGWLRTGYINGRQWAVLNNRKMYGDGQENGPGGGVFRFVLADGTIVEPDDGFVTDFASIPRLFWRIAPPVGSGAKGRYGPPAVLHDWLYQRGKVILPSGEVKYVDRKFADDVFLAAMVSLDVAEWRRVTMYRGVRLAGWMHFKEQTELAVSV